MPNAEGRPIPRQSGPQELHQDQNNTRLDQALASIAPAVDPDQALDRFLASIGSPRRHGQQRTLAGDGFTVWLIAQRHRDDWIGHLARDAAYDTTWPREPVRLRELHDYLHEMNALPAAQAALDQAWSEWREAAI